MLVDCAWFSIGCSIESGTFSPVKMVDPYASGWLAALACYPPLVSLSGQYFVWGPPNFPPLYDARTAIVYATIGLVLFIAYVIADFSFGFKTGNLTYRGLVDKGPYKIIRHPMYATKTTAWAIFTIPILNLHVDHTHLSMFGARMSVPIVAGNLALLVPMACWLCIYASRAFTEERYLLEFPEYREYCKRVRYRFFPGIL
jgi:protein-S-isoprenylcysteine O-methyltransferase Ste14